MAIGTGLLKLFNKVVKKVEPLDPTKIEKAAANAEPNIANFEKGTAKVGSTHTYGSSKDFDWNYYTKAEKQANAEYKAKNSIVPYESPKKTGSTTGGNTKSTERSEGKVIDADYEIKVDIPDGKPTSKIPSVSGGTKAKSSLLKTLGGQLGVAGLVGLGGAGVISFLNNAEQTILNPIIDPTPEPDPIIDPTPQIIPQWFKDIFPFLFPDDETTIVPFDPNNVEDDGDTSIWNTIGEAAEALKPYAPYIIGGIVVIAIGYALINGKQPVKTKTAKRIGSKK